MTTQEIIDSGPPEYVTYGRTPGTIYGYLSLYVKHPAGLAYVNHAESPTTVRSCRRLAKRLFPGLPFRAED